MNVNRILLIVALVCFVLAAIFAVTGTGGSEFLTADFLIPAGLAAWVAAALA